MSSKKTIFIIPGYRHGPTNKAYQSLAQILKSEGYEPIVVAIPWKKSTISENTQHFLKTYNKTKAGKKYVMGFSYGAMIAFIAATKVDVEGLILCSLSPFFSEDVFHKKQRVLSPLQADRRQDFLTLNAKQLAKQVKTEQVLLLYGSKEARSLIKRVKNTYAEIASSHKKMFTIKNTDHSVGDKNYLQTIHAAAKTLQ